MGLCQPFDVLVKCSHSWQDPTLPALELACRDPAGEDTLKALAERIKRKRLKLSRGSDSLDIQVSPVLPQQAEQARGGWFGFFQGELGEEFPIASCSCALVGFQQRRTFAGQSLLPASIDAQVSQQQTPEWRRSLRRRGSRSDFLAFRPLRRLPALHSTRRRSIALLAALLHLCLDHLQRHRHPAKSVQGRRRHRRAQSRSRNRRHEGTFLQKSARVRVPQTLHQARLSQEAPDGSQCLDSAQRGREPVSLRSRALFIGCKHLDPLCVQRRLSHSFATVGPSPYEGRATL